MSLATQITALATRIATEFKTAYSRIGTLANLTTTAKGDLVSAVNEVKAQVAGAATINDTTTNSTNTWSSSKINSAVTSAIAGVVGAAPAALDTLKEIADQLATDETATAGLVTAVGFRLRFDAAQSLTGTQQTQGQANLNVYSTSQIGDPATDFVAVFVAALT